jgi:DNA-binding CsgD family transcriptional regulator
MDHLTQRDFAAAQTFLDGLYSVHTFNGFVTYLLSALPGLIASNVTSYNEMKPARGHSVNWVMPEEVNTPERAEAWQRVMHEHPALIRYQRFGDVRVMKISDFLSARQFRRTALYNEHYRRLDAEDNLVFGFPGLRGVVNGVALHRDRPFTDRDRTMMDYIRLHVAQAYCNAVLVKHIVMMDKALENASRGLVTLDRQGRVRFATESARRWLRYYFGLFSADRLPEAVQAWVRHHDTRLHKIGEPVAPRPPLVVDREGRRLVVRLMSSPDEQVLLLEELRTSLDPAALRSMGLTPRESEVLSLATTGRTNAEIGAALGVSARTAQTHLERIYRRLQVGTRTAAVMKALEAERTSRAGKLVNDLELRSALSARLMRTI